MKRILGIVASPRKTGNSEILTKVAMEATGPNNHMEMIRLPELDIKPCRACYACLSPDAACSVDDDLNFLLDRIKAADAVIFAAPCYFLGPQGGIKMFQDRLLSVGTKSRDFAGKPCVTITTYGVPGREGYAEAVLNLTARFLNLNLVDSAAFLGANPAEVLADPGNVERARQLGRSLVDPHYRRQPKPIECPVCWSDMFRLEGRTATCPFCGARGKITAENGRVQLTFDFPVDHLFSEEAMRRHFEEFLPRKKREFLENREWYKELQKPFRSLDWWVTP